ncbi:site-specific recombinases, DNA invertase [Zymobacter palmae]|uniref:Site-specific recombinases, DNA invertase n=1 Tax=Zymobacter palmae TaxID=33074 RepID=A0A348HEB0_9GAMM|nr:site-specific recombinases, DNA invertase [Zymobacter palmae]
MDAAEHLREGATRLYRRRAAVAKPLSDLFDLTTGHAV